MTEEQTQSLDAALTILLSRNKEIKKQDELIEKHLNFNPNGDLRMASVGSFINTGKVSGSLYMALKAMMDEYADWHHEK